jgi:hypothetical protein
MCIARTFYDEMDQEEEDVGGDDVSTAKNSNEPGIDPYETDTDDKFDALIGLRSLLGGATRV